MSGATLALLIPLAFAMVWMLVVSLIGKISWGPLAQAYPAEDWPARGYKVRWQSAAIGMGSYSNAINAVATPEGLYLRPTLLFRVGHPPVFVPWRAFVDTAPGMFWGTRFILEEGPDLRFYGKLARAVTAALETYHEASGADPEPDEPTASGERKSGGLPWEAAAEEPEPRRSRRGGRRRA